MADTVTIRLPGYLKRMLDMVIRREKISKSDLIREALQQYLSVKNFRKIRKKVLPFAESQGLLTDEDIFLKPGK